MASLNEPPPEYAYAAVDKKKVTAVKSVNIILSMLHLLVLQNVVTSVLHQTAANGAQYAVSTKAADAKDSHSHDEIRNDPGVSHYSFYAC